MNSKTFNCYRVITHRTTNSPLPKLLCWINFTSIFFWNFNIRFISHCLGKIISWELVGGVCTWMCVYMCADGLSLVCTSGGQRSMSGRCQLFFYVCHSQPWFWRQSVPDPGTQLGWLVSRPWHPPISASLVPGLQSQSTMPIFFVDAEYPN